MKLPLTAIPRLNASDKYHVEISFIQNYVALVASSVPSELSACARAHRKLKCAEKNKIPPKK
jgi:hypothetical protein